MNRYIDEFGTRGLYNFSRRYARYHGYASICVCAFGVMCNVFNIVVLTRKNMISSTNIILTGLAVSDTLTMLSYVPFALQFYVIHGLKPNRFRNSHAAISFMLFHVQFTVTTHTISILLGVLLAIFRYAYIRENGSKHVIWSNVHKTKLTVLGVYLVSVVLMIPTYLTLRIFPYDVAIGNENVTYYEVMTIEERGNATLEKALLLVNFWVHAILVKLVPCLLMCLFGVLLIFTLRNTGKNAEQLRRNSSTNYSRVRMRDHSRTTRMLLVVLVLFLLTELPQGILALLSGVRPGVFEAVYTPLGDLMDMLALINNSINFTLYCTMSKQFRATFISLFCCWKPEWEGYVIVSNLRNLIYALRLTF